MCFCPESNFGFEIIEIWLSMFSKGRLEQELKIFPRYKKYWNLIKKKDSQMSEEKLDR